MRIAVWCGHFACAKGKTWPRLLGQFGFSDCELPVLSILEGLLHVTNADVDKWVVQGRRCGRFAVTILYFSTHTQGIFPAAFSLQAEMPSVEVWSIATQTKQLYIWYFEFEICTPGISFGLRAREVVFATSSHFWNLFIWNITFWLCNVIKSRKLKLMVSLKFTQSEFGTTYMALLHNCEQ